MRGTLRGVAMLAWPLCVVGCRSEAVQGADLDASLDAPPPWDVAQPEPQPRPGMVWIPGGVLIAGTPPERVPRVPDEEMAGEQVVLHGFYIDMYPFPNEPGAIPTTSASHADARQKCEEQNKRLCTELEWERACKGPRNTTYEYGDAYRPSVCGTGTMRALVPNGVNATCQSGFGVHDLHGSAWTWTESAWGRDADRPDLITQRGGNGHAGELIGRCANGRGAKPEVRRPDVGFRCCAGERNTFEVVLTVTRGDALAWQGPEGKIAPKIERLAPEEILSLGTKPEERFKIERMWVWHPLGNEELFVAGGCARPIGQAKRCGLVIARIEREQAISLAWIATDWWEPTTGEADTSRELFVYGGDRGGAFRKRVSYDWGRISESEKQRKKKHKGKREPTYD